MFSCAWEHSDKSNGHVLGPGTHTAPVPGRLSCRDVRDCTSLFPSGTDMAAFVAQAPEVLAHPYLSCLINVLAFCRVRRNWFWSGVKRKQFVGEVTRKCAFRPSIAEWQGVWQDLGRCLGWLSPPIAWDLTPLQACNPIELAHYLLGGRVPCLPQWNPAALSTALGFSSCLLSLPSAPSEEHG